MIVDVVVFEFVSESESESESESWIWVRIKEEEVFCEVGSLTLVLVRQKKLSWEVYLVGGATHVSSQSFGGLGSSVSTITTRDYY